MADRDKFEGMKAYVARVRHFVASMRTTLTTEQLSEVEHLVDHNEHGEALRALAWIVVEEDYRLSQQAYIELLDLSEGLVRREDMPLKLEDQVAAS